MATVYDPSVGKQYSLTASHNAGSPVLVRAIGVPYQTGDGAWRLRFNIVFTHSTSTNYAVTITGVTFKNVTGYYQSVSCGSGSVVFGRAYVNPGLSTITMENASGVTATYMSGDVELDSKPTFVS